MVDDPPNPKKGWWNRLRAEVAVGIAGIIIASGIGIWAVLDQRENTDRLAQQLQSTQSTLSATQADLSKARAENDALSSISLESFLNKYNAHVATLKTATEAYEKAKAAKGANISGSDAAGTLAHAQNDLYTATDNFTDFVDRWRSIADLLNRMLDGNVTQLKNSRRENNADDVHDAARRIINSAPDLAAPLRVALDRLKSAPPP
jgi:hypothetical protein